MSHMFDPEAQHDYAAMPLSELLVRMSDDIDRVDAFADACIVMGDANWLLPPKSVLVIGESLSRHVLLMREQQKALAGLAKLA